MWLTVAAIAGVAGVTAAATKGDPASTIGSALITGAVTQTIRHPIRASRFVIPIARPVGSLVWRAGYALAGDAVILGRAAANTSAAAFTAQVAAGYVLGSTTAIMGAAVLEEAGVIEQGASAELTAFYTFGLAGGETDSRARTKWYESDIPVLNIPGDIYYIGSQWRNW